MSALQPLTATGIGSVPFADTQEAVEAILQYLPQLPFWPQMVRLGFREEMGAQAAGGLPTIQVDEEARQVRVAPDTPRDQALAQFYESILAGELAPFALEKQAARGFFAMVEAVAAQKLPCPGLKGQVAGPVTLAGVVKDPEGKPILYDRELTQAVCQGLGYKAAWQAREFRQLGKEAVIFFDEPYLTGFGSAYLPVSREEVRDILQQTLEAARHAGPVRLGIHCCGNTDWSLLLEAPIDLLSFDSYGYFDSLRLYDKAVQSFLARGGWLAWGLVPTGEELERETTDSLWQRFQEQATRLAAEQRCGVGEILSQSLLTPACGMGYLTPETARRALVTLAELSARAQTWLSAVR